jgi:murein DD-endopeptidase MepM/ murein hydrolase activator NlpD
VQIILVHPKLRQARTLSLTRRHLAYALGVALFAFMLGSGLLYYITFQVAVALQVPFLKNIIESVAAEDLRRQEQRLNDSLQAMAMKLGDLQAQIARLEALGERVSGLAGIKPQEFGFGKPPGRGGAVPGAAAAQQEPRLPDLQREIEKMSGNLQSRAFFLNQIEVALSERSVARTLTPSMQPVNEGFVGSGFGWRHDPFTGRVSMHEGLDFAAPVGTPISAAAGGIVIVAEYHPAYGKMVDLDHGNGLTTRYAHASKLHVKVGDIVKRGQLIADVGSTGRSTGPHLHFEVRVNGEAKDPEKFLAVGQMLPAVAANK